MSRLDPRMMPVAVKRMRITTLMEQTWKDYVTEIKILGKLSHRNLVELIGWCHYQGDDGKKLLLVHDLVPNKSLDRHLHGSERLLSWAERYKIVLGIGSGIEYLHNGCSSPILHRDIKPGNVMLDDDFVPKLGDFGLVRKVDPGEGSLRGTRVIGSRDYIDPVCIIKNTTSTASDMYSFGVLLLEVATGKSPRVSGDKEQPSLPNNFILIDAVHESYIKGAVVEMADARLNGDFDKNEMERVLVVGLLCVHPDRRVRPDIREAINFLSNLNQELPESKLVYDRKRLLTKITLHG